MIAPWLWVVFTLIGSTAQTFRNATQRSLTDTLGTVGATHIRFLFGLPFGLLFLAVVAIVNGNIPAPTWASLAWTAMGAITQIGGTALMLAAMRERSFVVAIAYTKTEPLQVAVFGLVFLGEPVTLTLAAAIVIATVGVVALSWPSRAGGELFSWRPALLGTGSGALFALATIGFRGGITSLDDASFVPAATLTLAISLFIQAVVLSAWLMWRDRSVLLGVVREWRRSLPAGALGAFASEMWFLAFAIESPAKVRTLALVEIVIAGIVSRRFFAQTPGVRDIAGMALVIVGIVLLFSG